MDSRNYIKMIMQNPVLSQQMIHKHWLIITACILFSVSFTIGCSHGLFKTIYTPDEVFNQAADRIERNYMDPSGKSVKLDTSMSPDINTLLAQLDSSVSLWSKDELAANRSKGATGIGLKLTKGEWHISRVVVNSPAYLAGLHRNDKIDEIDGESVEGLSTHKVFNKLQGDPGSEVTVKITKSNGETKAIKIIRRIIDPKSVVAVGLIENKIGYARVTNFSWQTPSEVTDAVKKLLNQNMEGLIIDLRNNDGGVLDSVADTLELFIPKGTPIVHLVSSNLKDEITIKANRRSHFTFPVAVVIDKNTTSGAELFAAVLKETDRAILIGEKTMAVGTIRKAFPLGDGSALTMRIAYMQTGTGKAIEGRGVQPDVEVALSNEEVEKLYDKLESVSATNVRESSDDIQLKTAVSLLADQVANSKPALITK